MKTTPLQKITNAVVTIITTTIAVMAIFLIRNKLINDGYFNFIRTTQVVQAQLDARKQDLNDITEKLARKMKKLEFKQTKEKLRKDKQLLDQQIVNNQNFIGTSQYKEHKKSIAAEEAKFESKYNEIIKLRLKKRKIKNDIYELEDELKYLQSQNETEK